MSHTLGETAVVVYDNLWKSMFGDQGQWTKIRFYRAFHIWPPTGYNNGEGIFKIIQKQVDLVLAEKAEKYLELCNEQEYILNKYPVGNEFSKPTPIEDAKRLRHIAQMITIFKKEFWSSWHLAKGWGFETKKRAKDYFEVTYLLGDKYNRYGLTVEI